ncbi:MAVS protein, partial [Penelope pileata]|nr:MAVS protein [Penelope pileata]
MGFAEDKVYSHILKNMSRFCNIHVASLVDSLSCLTDADRDELHTRNEMRGTRATAYKFYQHLKCRKGWVTDLINALHHNNAGHLAEELQQVYDRHQVPPPSAPAPVAVSSVSAPVPFLGPNPAAGAPLAEPLRCSPSAGSHPPLPPAAAAAVTSAASSDISSTDLDARAPVQESLVFFQLPEQKGPQPALPVSTVCDRASDAPGEEKPLPYPTKVQQEALETPRAPSTVLPSALPPAQGQEWLSQRHPVCVDNGCFGNANHLHRGTPGLGLGRSLPSRDLSTARGPEQPRNEPQEDVYISTELPLEPTCSGGPQPPESLRTQKKEAVSGSEHREPPGSFVDVRSPLLIQQQVDAEQKRIEMLREHEGDGDVRMDAASSVTTPAPRDSSPSCDVSLKPPVAEKMLPGGEAASSTPSMPEKEKVLSASAASLSGMAHTGSFEAGRISSPVSSATSAWASHGTEEEDVQLSKPGILLSVAEKSPEAANSNKSFSLGSDPLMVSTDSSSPPGEALSRATSGRQSAAPAAREDTRGEDAAGASPHPPPSWDSTSVRTYEVHVEHRPSALLEAANDVRDGAGPFGNPPDPGRGHSAASSSPQATPGDSNGPSLLYILPAVGIALISVYLVYARLQK